MIKLIFFFKVNEEKLVVFEGLIFDVFKIKEFVVFFKNIFVDIKVLIVVVGESENVELFVCNL